MKVIGGVDSDTQKGPSCPAVGPNNNPSEQQVQFLPNQIAVTA